MVKKQAHTQSSKSVLEVSMQRGASRGNPDGKLIKGIVMVGAVTALGVAGNVAGYVKGFAKGLFS